MIHVGQLIEIGWNGAKYLDERVAYSEVRVEAVGVDWFVVRDSVGRAHAATFEHGGHEQILQELES